MLQSLRIARGHQLGEIELLGLSSSNGQGHRLSHENTPGKYRQVALLAIGNLARSTDCLVGEHSHVIGNGNPPGKSTGLFGRNFESQIGHFVAEILVHALVGSGIVESQANRPLIVGDWLETLTVNSILSPSRRNRGGLG